MNFFNKLTTLGKVLISIVVIIIVGCGCWLGGLFNGLGLNSPFIKNVPTNNKLESSSTTPIKETSVNSNVNKTNKTIRISLDSWIGWKPLVDANGGLKTQPDSINAKNGIDVEYVIIDNADQSSAALINGDIDGAGYTINRYAFLYNKFVKNGLNPKYVFSTNVSSGGDGIIAKSDINSIEDLYGKKIGVPKFSEAMTLMDWLIEQSSLTAEQKTEMRNNMIMFDTPDDAAKAFFAGQIDAAATWQPYLSQAQSMTNCKLLFSTKNATNLIVDGLIFDESFIKENEDALTKLVEGAIEAHSMYFTDMDSLRASIPLFSLEDDESIAATLKDASLLNAEGNKKSLGGEAQALFADMSDIWKNRGEDADRNNAEKAFSSVIVDKLDVTKDVKTGAEPTLPTITEEKKETAAKSVDTASLLKMTADIRFEPNTAIILEDSYAEMDRFYDTASMLNGAIIVVEGNISDYQQSGVNSEGGIQLSYERAKAVAKYLQMKGIDPNRFEIIGNGISKQKGNNATEEGQKMNRRTDLSFMLVE